MASVVPILSKLYFHLLKYPIPEPESFLSDIYLYHILKRQQRSAN